MNRIKSIDLARGFTVLFIPIIHSVMVFSKPEIHATIFVKFLVFVAEWPGAQIFMLLMGVSFALTKQTSLKRVFTRSIVLLLVGYLLNGLKFLIPYFSNGLPTEFLNYMEADSWQSFFLIGDIFHFACLALVVLYLVKQFSEYAVIAMLIAVTICFGSRYWWDMRSENVIVDHLLILISGQPPNCYFPLLPWIVYPLTGLAIGAFMKQSIMSTYIALFFLGLAIFFISSSIYFSTEKTSVSFYRTEAWDTLRHLGFAFSWLSLWWMATVFPDNLLFRILAWCGKRITLVYVVQWPVIFWLVPLLGFQSLDFWESIVIGMDVSLFTILIALIVKKRSRETPKI